ncbi:MAG: hypothetical protein ACXW2A_05985 [Burkholderiales bacterium]
MWRMVLPALLLAGCAQLPPSPEDLQGKKFESLPDKSVIYVVRMPMDSNEGRSLMLNAGSLITTYRGTYYRWEVAPGTHRVAGFPGGSESVTLTTAPGRIYFLEHTVVGDPDDGGVQVTNLRQVNDQAGRRLVQGSQLLR